MSDEVLSEKARLEQYLEVAAPQEKKYMNIVEGGFEKYPLLHISPDTNIKKFEPKVTQRTLPKGEDRAIPRICTTPTIFGCIVGAQYTQSHFDFGGDKQWKGGYYLYGFKPEISVRPEPKLLADVDACDEHWLLRYSPKTQKYTPDLIGKMFLHETTRIHDARIKQSRVVATVWYVEIFEGKSALWANDVPLEAGYHRVTYQNDPRADGKVTFTHEQIGKEAFESAKGLTADLLSMVEQPPSMRW